MRVPAQVNLRMGVRCYGSGDSIVGRTGRLQDLGTITQVITSDGGINLKI